MQYRDNINPLAHLHRWEEAKFEKFLNPSDNPNKRDEWRKNYDETFRKYLMVGVNMPMDMKKNFTVMLMLYPFKSNEDKTFFKLNDNGKVGYLNKHLIKKARTCKVDEPILRKYESIKKEYKQSKIWSSVNSDKSKSELASFTYMILEICFSKNTRSGKLDALLDD